jgi:hypothetical protein
MKQRKEVKEMRGNLGRGMKQKGGGGGGVATLAEAAWLFVVSFSFSLLIGSLCFCLLLCLFVPCYMQNIWVCVGSNQPGTRQVCHASFRSVNSKRQADTAFKGLSTRF